MEISSSYGISAGWSSIGTGKMAQTSRVAASDVLSASEKSFFNKTLHTELKTGGPSAEMFSNQAISAMNTQEMSYWSGQLRGYGSSEQQPRPMGLNILV